MENWDLLKNSKVDYSVLKNLIKESTSSWYFSKNKQNILQNKNVKEIIMVKDCNCYDIFWRYFWIEDDILYYFTGKNVLDKEEEENILLQLRTFSFNETGISVSKLDSEKYLLKLEHPL